MRWINKKFELKNKEGETRIVHKFLLFPRSFAESQFRWFEWAWVVEEVKKVDVGGSCEWGNYAWKWMETGFIDPSLETKANG